MSENIGAGFADREYLRVCAMCGYTADPGYPWEDNLRPIAYCPKDGTPLERLSCQSCGAPVIWERGSGFFGGGLSRYSLCGHCGEPVTRAERKMRERPQKEKDAEAARTPHIAPPWGIPMGSVYKMFCSDALYASAPVAKPRPIDLKVACAYRKAAPGCTCPGCKSVRRHQRRNS